MMKINRKKIISMALATMIAVGSTSAYAATFSDVKNDWAKTYIYRANELGLVKGNDGKFEPARSMTRIETISLAARILTPTAAETEKARTKYKKVLLDNKIPDWAIDDLAVALSEGIIDTGILKNIFNKNGALSLSPREEVVIYLVKAMGLQKQVEALPGNIKLPFKDASKVYNNSKPYVYIMNNLEVNGVKIIEGDDQGNFNPKSSIRRDSMAKVITMAYDYIEENKKKDEVVTPKPEQLTTVTGSIHSLLLFQDGQHIVIENEYGKRDSYKIDAKTVLKIDGSVVSFNSLKEGLKIRAEVTTGVGAEAGIVRTLNSETVVENYDGFISSIRDTGTRGLTIEYVENGISKRKTFDLGDNVSLLLDNKEVAFSQLRENDRAKIQITNGRVSRIDAKAYVRDMEGFLKTVDKDGKFIEVQVKDGSIVKYELHKDVTLTRDRKSARVSELRRGDKLEIRVEGERVTRLDAEIIRSTVSGRVQSKNISYDQSYITVADAKDKLGKTYAIPADADIRINGKKARLDQIELGYYVEVRLEGEEVIQIDGQPDSVANQHIGRITNVEDEYIEITLNNTLLEKVRVKILRDTVLEELSTGVKINYVRSFNRGDAVLVTGEIYGGTIDAVKVSRF